MKKKPPKTKLKLECDKLWSRITKEIQMDLFGPKCPWCKGKDFQQSDHIINRWKHSTRWRVENCVCLCSGCHLFRKKRDPMGWAEMVREFVGDDTLAKLKEMSNEPFKVDMQGLQAVHEYLTKLDKEKPGRTKCQDAAL